MPRIVLSVACLLFAPLSIWAQPEWPQWRGPKRDGVGSEKGLLSDWTKQKPTLLWNSKEVNGGKSIAKGWSSISISGGRIFTMGDRGKECFVFALDLKTGKHIWEKAIGTTMGNGGPRCCPTVDGSRLYALTNAGQLACLETDSGKIVWSKDLAKDFGGKWMASWYFCESPLVDGEKLICTPGAESAGMVALVKSTGAVIWKATIPKSGGCGYSSIMVSEGAGVRQYITFMGSGQGLVSIEASTGKLLWNYRKVANGTGNIPTAIIKGDYVFASSGYGTGAVLLHLVADSGGVKAVEQYFLKGGTLQNHHGQMILVGDHIYGGHGHNDGKPFCLHMMSGKFAWGPEATLPYLSDPDKKSSAAVAYADGHMYFRYENNTIALIEATPTKFNLKGLFPIPAKGLVTGWPQPVILDGKMYIRSEDQLLCFDVKAR